jgi:hypothetical protein
MGDVDGCEEEEMDVEEKEEENGEDAPFCMKIIDAQFRP